MYHLFYGLRSDPFRLTPDPAFCYRHPRYAKALAYMQYALRQGEGFILVTGLPGTGKTTLIEQFHSELNNSRTLVARLTSTQLQADELLRLICLSMGVSTDVQDKASVLHRLREFLIQQAKGGRRILLLIDEAQDLPEPALEELRLLGNLQFNARSLLQIFLVGQQQLLDMVQRPSMQPLVQRLVAACNLEPLSLEETRAYIEHRLRCAGWSGEPVFDVRSFHMIHRFSEGFPRQINKVCSRLLLYGSIENKYSLDCFDCFKVLRDLFEELPGSARQSGLEACVDILNDAWRGNAPGDSAAAPVSVPPPADLDVQVASLVAAEPAPDRAPGATAAAPVSVPSPADLEVQVASLVAAESAPDRAPGATAAAPVSARSSTDLEAQTPSPVAAEPAPDRAREAVARADVLAAARDTGRHAAPKPAQPQPAAVPAAAVPGQPVTAAATVVAAAAEAEAPPVQAAPDPDPSVAAMAAATDGAQSGSVPGRWWSWLNPGPVLGFPLRRAAAPLGVVAALLAALVLVSGNRDQDAAVEVAGPDDAPALPGSLLFAERAPDAGVTASPGRLPEGALADAGAGQTGAVESPAEAPPPEEPPPAALPVEPAADPGSVVAASASDGVKIVGAAQPEAALEQAGQVADASAAVAREQPTQPAGLPGGAALASLAGNPQARDTEGSGGTPAQAGAAASGVLQDSAAATETTETDATTALAGVQQPGIALQTNSGPDQTGTPGPAAADAGAVLRAAGERNRIDDLMAQAARALRNNRLTTPRSDNAYRYYREVLELAPGHRAARDGMQRIVDRYAVLIKAALAEDQTGRASAYVARGLVVKPGDQRLLALQGEVAARESWLQAQADREAAQAQVARQPPPPAAEPEAPQSFLDKLKELFSNPVPRDMP